MKTGRPVAIIGFGGIARSLLSAAGENEPFEVRNVVVRQDRLSDPQYRWGGARFVSSVAEIDPDVELVVEAAGHSAVRQFASEVCASGRDLALVSTGALADDDLRGSILAAADANDVTVHALSGAIGALDALVASRAAGPQSVRYTGVKPAAAWRGTPAEDAVDLDGLSEPTIFFSGTAGEVARLYPKNANVAATVALASNGFHGTAVTLIADPVSSLNRHLVEAETSLGGFRFEATSKPSASNPKTSGSTAFSILAYLRYGTNMLPINGRP